MGFFSTWRKRLLARALRNCADLDDCQRKALSALDADHLRAFNSAVRQIQDYADPGPRARVIPLLSRDIALARLMNQTPFDKVRGVCAELLDMHAKELAKAKTDGTFAKLATLLATGVVSALAPKVPPLYYMIHGEVEIAVAACLEQGWHPQVAGGIAIHRVLENPMRYLKRTDPPSSYQSSAPYRVSRSEMRR